MNPVTILLLLSSLSLAFGDTVDLYSVNAVSSAPGHEVYLAIDTNQATYWQPDPSSIAAQSITFTFSSPQVLTNFTWIISSTSDYNVDILDMTGVAVASHACTGQCNPNGESLILPAVTSISGVLVTLTGINLLPTSSSQRADASNAFHVYEVFAFGVCHPGSPFDFATSTCDDNCGLVPDPLQYQNIPTLDMSKVKLQIDGVLSLVLEMPSVQTREITETFISGTQSCGSALVVPWQVTTENNTCASEIASKYSWLQMWTTCPNNIVFFENNDTASAWILIDLKFIENITVANGARGLSPRGSISRDYLAEYSLGIVTQRYLTLETSVNITTCDGVVCAPPGQCQLNATCNNTLGYCVYPPAGYGTSCDDNNLCSVNDTCTPSGCVGTIKVCNNPPSSCYEPVGLCDSSNGECVYKFKADSTACDDGDLCTYQDSCQIGVCVGTPVVCSASDQCHDAGVCDPMSGTCSNPVLNGTVCNDNNLCTLYDTCYSGVCVGTEMQCHGDQCNDAGTCNPVSGVCENIPKNGTSCNDGNACTLMDICIVGTCVGYEEKICASSDQCHEVGVCDPSSGFCSNPMSVNGTMCSDDNLCTYSDQCQNGLCIGTPVICSASDQCHEVGVCDPSSGFCSDPVSINGKTCTDGSLCTTNDTCHNGFCYGDNVICSAQDDCHYKGTCDNATGVCTNPSKADGATCNDGDACTSNSTCNNGVCTGVQVTCPPAEQCWEYSHCDSMNGTCVYTMKPNGATCFDNNMCTQIDTCMNGVCVGSSPIVCSAMDNCHDIGTCNPITGNCSNPELTDGTYCDDSNSCTQNDTCISGTCTGTNPVVCPFYPECNAYATCNAGNGTCEKPCQLCNASVICDNPPPCHGDGFCNQNTGKCEYVPLSDGSYCNDNDLCTSNDYCLSGTCVSNVTKSCSAFDACHVSGVCNPQTGECSHPLAADNTSCDDGDLCTQLDQCYAGMCVGSNPVVCSAPGQCHMPGICNATTGTCDYDTVSDGSSCNDGSLCTYADQCVAGVCFGTPVTCDAPNSCYDSGYCDESSGSCVNTVKPNGTQCSDNNACTTGDYCRAGSCISGSPIICEALDQCHDAGVCDTNTGFCSNPSKLDGSSCSDSNLCTLNDACYSGICTSNSSISCIAMDECHDSGVCNPATGICTNPNAPDGKTCSDNNACSNADHCYAGTCVGSNFTLCSALNDCHDVGVCDPQSGLCSNPPKLDGTLCSDGDLCSQMDQCYSGNCIGSNYVICETFGECEISSTCSPNSGLCVVQYQPDGHSCEDGDLCTTGDRCLSGTCSPNSTIICPEPDSCHLPGTCNSLTGTCSLPTKPDGSLCNDTNSCSNTDTCMSGICVGSNYVTCPITSCNLTGVCDTMSGVCSDPCPPTVTGALISQTIKNQIPFIIEFATFTTKDGILDNPTVLELPFTGNYTISTNSSRDEVHSHIVTQYWTMYIYPIGSCTLNGTFSVEFFIHNYFDMPVTLNFKLNSQNFCGQVTNTSIAGHVKTFSDATYTNTSSVFAPKQKIYVWISVESAFSVSEVDLVTVTVNGIVFPAYGIDDVQQVSYGVQFSMLTMLPPFIINSNDLSFTVKLSYNSPGRKRSTDSDKPESLSFTKIVGILELDSDAPATDVQNSVVPTKGGLSLILMVVSGAGLLSVIALLIIVIVWRVKKSKQNKRQSLILLLSKRDSLTVSHDITNEM